MDDRIRHQIDVARRKRQQPPLRWFLFRSVLHRRLTVLLATRIPLGGIDTREGISRAEVGERFGMPAFRFHIGKRLIAGADCLDKQQAGHDRDLVARLFRFRERDVRRLSTAYDIQKT